MKEESKIKTRNDITNSLVSEKIVLNEKITRMVSVKIEESLFKKIRTSGHSFRQLLWLGVNSLEGNHHHLEILEKVRDQMEALRGSHKILYGEVIQLQKDFAVLLADFGKEHKEKKGFENLGR